jgi:hypothetical protein
MVTWLQGISSSVAKDTAGYRLGSLFHRKLPEAIDRSKILDKGFWLWFSFQLAF